MQSCRDGIHRVLRGDFARSLPPHPIHNDKDTPFGLAENPVFIILPSPCVSVPPGFEINSARCFLHVAYLERMV
jgi:hypothetical protein